MSKLWKGSVKKLLLIYGMLDAFVNQQPEVAKTPLLQVKIVCEDDQASHFLKTPMQVIDCQNRCFRHHLLDNVFSTVSESSMDYALLYCRHDLSSARRLS